MERHWFFFWSVDGIFTFVFFSNAVVHIVYTRRCYAPSTAAAAAAAAVDVDITKTDFRAALCCSLVLLCICFLFVVRDGRG